MTDHYDNPVDDDGGRVPLFDDEEETPTEWVIWCATHQHYAAKFEPPAPVWAISQDDARRFGQGEVHKVIEAVEWLDHNPTPWAVPARPTDPSP